MPKPKPQDVLFAKIREILPVQVPLSEAIGSVLNISADSAYRRIRGETALVIDETIELCRHFNISFDKLVGSDEEHALFRVTRLEKRPDTFRKYLEAILGRLEILNQFPEKNIYYTCKDMPLFHALYYEKLFAFRYFFWMKSIVHHPDFENALFSPDCLPDDIKAIGKKIIIAYQQVPSVEVWNTECINSIIFQLEHYKGTGMFEKKEHLTAVYDSLIATVEHICQQAEHGAKFLPGEAVGYKKENYQFFYNRVTLSDNIVLTESGPYKTVFLNYDILSFLLTSDKNFCAATLESIRNLMQRSTLISQTSEKQRRMFFNILLEKVKSRIHSY